MLRKTLFPLLAFLSLGACSGGEQKVAAASVPWVKTVAVQSDRQSELVLSGTVHARAETPLAFQVGGRIVARHVDAGQRVQKAQLLFELDPRDLEQSVRVAAADRSAAKAALDTARADVARHRQLLAQKYIGPQIFERVELAMQEASKRLDAAEAQLQQARNARSYGVLRAGNAGVLIDVSAERGQVVNPGQLLAVLARDGERDVEVFLPDGFAAPREGQVLLDGGKTLAIALREMAGAADPVSRTWRARYKVPGGGNVLQLGTVVQVTLASGPKEHAGVEVPIGALDDRADGPRVWRVVDGKARPLPVKVLALDTETALIDADLPANSRVIALGTHLLTPGMAVRERLP